MANEKILAFRKKFAEQKKAKAFIREFYKENNSFPTNQEINEAKALTEDENAQLAFDVAVSQKVAQNGQEFVATWDYIWDENSWNAAYNKENSALAEYYATYPDEDRWNMNENRACRGNDKVDGEWPDYCVHCWQGAVGAPGAQYPWCVVNIEPFKGIIRFEYDGGEPVYPWGENARTFKRNFAIASIPVELGQEFLLKDGQTTFDPSKLVVTLIKL